MFEEDEEDEEADTQWSAPVAVARTLSSTSSQLYSYSPPPKPSPALWQWGDRIVASVDLDCFYAQCEELRHPELKGKPVGVQQKLLVVTSNYEARKVQIPSFLELRMLNIPRPTDIVTTPPSHQNGVHRADGVAAVTG